MQGRHSDAQAAGAAPGAGRRARASGSVMLEFVIAFPLLLALMLACMQFAHIWMAKQVVHYAAFCAARAALVCEAGRYQEAGQRAAEQVCAWISEGTTGGEADKQIPGWGSIPGSGGVGRKTRVEVRQLDRWNVEATVQFDFGMMFPIAGPMIGWMMSPWETGQEWLERRADESGNIGDADLDRYPHLRFRETVVLPKPYVTMARMGLPASGW